MFPGRGVDGFDFDSPPQAELAARSASSTAAVHISEGPGSGSVVEPFPSALDAVATGLVYTISDKPRSVAVNTHRSYQTRAIISETDAADAGEATAGNVDYISRGLATSVFYGLSIVTGRSGTGVEAALEFGVDGLGLGELIFKDDDSARRIEGGTTVDQFTSPRGDPQLIAGIAAMTAVRALRCEQFRLIEASQEPRGGSQNSGGTAHAVGGVVLVVELIVWVTVGRIVIRLYHNAFRGTQHHAHREGPTPRVAIIAAPGLPALRKSPPTIDTA
jgi:hypothetical protein